MNEDQIRNCILRDQGCGWSSSMVAEADRANSHETFNVGIRKAWERLGHQVSHFGHLQYHPVTFSDTEMVRGKDPGPCCWWGKLNTWLPLLSPSESYLGSHDMTNSWLWGSSFPSLDCCSYWETFLYTGYLHICVLIYCHSAWMITGQVWVWMPRSQARQRSNLNWGGW